MSKTDWIVSSRRVVTPQGLVAASIEISGEKIHRVTPHPEPNGLTFTHGNDVVMPGIVDSHVHINEPGRTEWEGFVHASRAAAAGGVTTVVDMPLNSLPVTTTVKALEEKRRAAEQHCHVDFGFWGGLVPGNTRDLAPLREAGVLGFKCFLVPSGIPEFPEVTDEVLESALPVLAREEVPLLVHAEDPAAIAPPDPTRGGARRYETYLASRPPRSEVQAIERMIRLARSTGGHVHIVHLACASAIEPIRVAKDSGVSLSVETCPHYLTFAAGEIPSGATEFKCAPPIRDATHREGLWGGLTSGIIDLVASDHSPCLPALKQLETGDFLAAWGGVASLQLGLSAIWTGVRKRGIDLSRLGEWMCEAPARLAGLRGKGRIEAGYDADLVIWDPDESFRVDAGRLEHRHAVTPYDGLSLWGIVRETILRGTRIYDRGSFPVPPGGRWLRGRAA